MKAHDTAGFVYLSERIMGRGRFYAACRALGALIRNLHVRHRAVRFLAPWIHRLEDGRGVRECFVDGVKVRRAVYANTLTGYVRYHGEDPVFDPATGSFVGHELRGKVTIEWPKP